MVTCGCGLAMYIAGKEGRYSFVCQRCDPNLMELVEFPESRSDVDPRI